MRQLTRLLVGLLIISMAAGCTNRRWGTCALVGGLAGAVVGAGTAGGLVNAYGKDGRHDSGYTGAGAGGGAVVGGLLGTLIGHAVCDPEEEAPPPPPVAQAAPPPPPPPPPAKGTKIATIGGAQFDYDRSDIKPAGREVLATAVKVLRDNRTLHVVIEGHTDSVGSDAYNQKLSERRANSVRDYLVRQGIDSSRITTRGYGESRPIASNATPEGRAQNRRADIIAD
jgi:OOP family OmpA-OmpF porin